MIGWAKIKAISRYSGVSERTVEDWLKNGLRYVQLPSGLRLIKFEWVDEYLEGFNNQGDKIEQIVNEVIAKI
jgi:excisionase family DNA binding protein